MCSKVFPGDPVVKTLHFQYRGHRFHQGVQKKTKTRTVRWLLKKYSKCKVESESCLFQFSSVTQSCPTLCDSMECSTPGLTVHHQLPKPTQTPDHCISDAIQPSHPLSSPSPPAIFPCIRVFSSESVLPIRWPKY